MFEIAGGCSGLHFFIVAPPSRCSTANCTGTDSRTRVKLVALAIALAMLTNWIRISIIIVAGHLTDMQHYLVSGEHYSFGWAVFAVAMAIYFLIVRRWVAERPAVAAPPARGRVRWRRWNGAGLRHAGVARHVAMAGHEPRVIRECHS